MIRSALLLCAGILAASSFACVQQAAAPPPPVGPQPFLASCDAQSFAASVQMVPARFDPTSTTVSPTPVGPVPDNMRDDLRAAFTMAPPFFRQQLCDLDGVFINQGAGSWGFRKFPTGERYVAITAELWAGRKSAQDYPTFEAELARRLLKSWPGITSAAHMTGAANSAAMTVLAALAHEYGHVLWYNTFVPVPRGPADFRRFCGGTFYDHSWEKIPKTEEPPQSRWRAEGLISSRHKADDVRNEELVEAAQADTPPGHTTRVGQILRRIYGMRGTKPPFGRWASMFATFSAEEDFVETFKLFVLKNADPPLQSLPISFPIGRVTFTGDIPATCSSRPVLQKKLSCFAQTLCGAPATADPCNPLCPPR